MHIFTKTIFACLFFIVSIATIAQKGGFGYFIAGTNFLLGTKAQERLQAPTLLGSGFRFNNPGLMFGGRGMAVFGRFMMGGSGYGGNVTGTTDSAKASMGIGGGFFNVGYTLIRKEKSMVYVLGGFGGGGGTLQIYNNGTSTRQFSAGQQIPAGENRKISGGGLGFEFGIGINQLIMSEGSSRFMIGAVAGINYFPSAEWVFEANETSIAGLGRRSSFYIGITIGGGSF